MLKNENIQRKLLLLRKEFTSKLIERVEQMRLDLNSLPTQTDPQQVLDKLFIKIHSLSGSAGTFGFKRLGGQSRQLELILKKLVADHSAPSAKDITYLNAGLGKLIDLIDQGIDEDNLSNSLSKIAGLTQTNERTVYLLADNFDEGTALCHQLEHFGYHTRLFSTAIEVDNAVNQVKPDALIIDIYLPEKGLADTNLNEQILPKIKENLPIIFISSHQDWHSRLAAVRAGGSAYFDKPVNVSALVGHLDKTTVRIPGEPYRVLILDDAVELAQHYKLILQSAGIQAKVLTEPSSILQNLDSFKPDLILLDYYLKDITGSEVAQVLRQHPIHFSLPIVFLSTESNTEIQSSTLRQSDDFLEKPVLESHLVSRVVSRIERARTLSQLMYYDGLTGLPNQITLRQLLKSEFARAKKQGYLLSVILLDLDRFKRVNDRYGHSAGDQVLKSLACLLKSRLRQSDACGRYFGEKFAIILPDTETDKALEIVEMSRQSFALLDHQVDDLKFNCSFSAGIASAQEFNTDKDLLDAADKALFLAKSSGLKISVIYEHDR